MARFVLDTNILIQLVRGKQIANEVKIYLQSQDNPDVFISIVSLAEAESLVTQWNWSEEKIVYLRTLLDHFVTIEIGLAQYELIENYVGIDAFSQGKRPSPGGKMIFG